MNPILFIADPIESFHPEKDSTIAMIAAAHRRSAAILTCQPQDLYIQAGQVFAHTQHITFLGYGENWYQALETMNITLTACQAVFMRKDPPVDSAYWHCLQLLSLAEEQGAKVINRASALRDINEKLFINAFPQCITDTEVTSSAERIRQFVSKVHDAILKPLDGMGGQSIFRVKQHDPNLSVIIETLTQQGQASIMLQRYLPEVTQGDKRILMINGEPVPFAVARLPKDGETRANLAAGGRARVQPLSERDRWLCQQVGPELVKRGVYLAGLDVIGDYITEINVTSPTCFRDLLREENYDVAEQLFASVVL